MSHRIRTGATSDVHTDMPRTLRVWGGGSQGNDLITSHCKYKNTTTCEQTRSRLGPEPHRGAVRAQAGEAAEGTLGVMWGGGLRHTRGAWTISDVI